MGAQQRGVCPVCLHSTRAQHSTRAGPGAPGCCQGLCAGVWEGPVRRDGQGTFVKDYGDSQDSGSSMSHPRGVLCDCTSHVPRKPGPGRGQRVPRARGLEGLPALHTPVACGPVTTPTPCLAGWPPSGLPLPRPLPEACPSPLPGLPGPPPAGVPRLTHGPAQPSPARGAPRVCSGCAPCAASIWAGSRSCPIPQL